VILNDVHVGISRNRKRKRIGRGTGSGHGKTSGRGHKGYGSRAGSSRRIGFEGGQMPLFRRIAKRGFNNAQFAPVVVVINVRQLDSAFEAGTEVSPDVLASRGLIPSKFDKLKILGDGELTKQLTVTAHQFSASAEQKIAAAGGSVSVIERKTRSAE
jgi:large subunit ribosomal protein L15